MDSNFGYNSNNNQTYNTVSENEIPIYISSLDKVLAALGNCGLYGLVVVFTKAHNGNRFIKKHLNVGIIYWLLYIVISFGILGTAQFLINGNLFEIILSILNLIISIGYSIIGILNIVRALMGKYPISWLVNNINIIK